MWDVGDDYPACGVVGWDSVHELLYGMGTFGHRLMGNVICTTCHYDGVTIRTPRHVGDVVSEPLGGGTRISIADGWKLFAINHGARPSHHRAPNDNQTFLMPRSSGSIDTMGRGLCNWWFGCATTLVCTRGVLFLGAPCRPWEDWVTEWESLLSSSAASTEKRLLVLISCQVSVILEAEEQELSLIVWISFWSSLFCWVSWSAFTFNFPFSDFKLSLSDFNCRNSALVFTCSVWSSFTHFVSCCICARKSFMVRGRIRHRSHAQTPT